MALEYEGSSLNVSCSRATEIRVLATALLLVLPSVSAAQAPRQYEAMTQAEASGIAQDLLKAGQLPPVSPTSEWERSEGLLLARGLKLGGTDFVVFVATAVKGYSMFHAPQKGNLGTLSPELEKISWRGGTIPFVLNGVLFTKTDLEFPDNVLFTFSGTGQAPDNQWSRAPQTLRKGAYHWYVGPAGLWLQRPGEEGRLVAFRRPIVTLNALDALHQRLYLPQFDPLPNGAEIRVVSEGVPIR